MMKCFVSAANSGSCTCPSSNGKLLHPNQQPEAQHCTHVWVCVRQREREREKERERENQGGRESLIWCQKQSALHTLRLFMTRPTAQVITESKILKNPTAENVPLQVKTGCVRAVDSSTCIMIMCCHLPTIVNSVRMMPMRELGIAAFTHFLKPHIQGLLKDFHFLQTQQFTQHGVAWDTHQGESTSENYFYNENKQVFKFGLAIAFWLTFTFSPSWAHAGRAQGRWHVKQLHNCGGTFTDPRLCFQELSRT